MFTGRKRNRKIQGKDESEIFQKPQKRRKVKKSKQPSESFSFSDSLLTSHLFSSLTPFISQLGTELEDKNIDETSLVSPPPPPLWEDGFCKEMKIEGLPDDPVQSKLLKYYIEKSDVSAEVNDEVDEDEDDDGELEKIETENKVSETTGKKAKKKSVMIQGNVYEDSLRKIYTRYHPTPKWYQKEMKKENMRRKESTSTLLHSTRRIIQKSKTSTTHKFRKLQNLNIYEYPSKVHKVLSVSFHPTTSLSAVLSTDRVVRVYRVDGTDNPMVQKFSQFRTRLGNVYFSKSGEELIVTTIQSKRYFIMNLRTGEKSEHVVDLIRPDYECPSIALSQNIFVFYGKGPNAYVVSAKTNRLLHIHRTNGRISCCCFCTQSKYLFISTLEGRIYIYNTQDPSGRPVNIFLDESAVRVTRISVSHEYIATGSDSGVVSIYPLSTLLLRPSETETRRGGKQQPFKTLMNLTTRIDFLEFSRGGGLLCCGSSVKEDQVRLFRVPTFRCYEKFPNFGKYGKKSLVMFNGSGFSGNEKWFYLVLRRRIYLYSVDTL